MPVFKKAKKKDLRNVSLISASSKNWSKSSGKPCPDTQRAGKDVRQAQIYQKYVMADLPDTFLGLDDWLSVDAGTVVDVI